MIPLPDYRMSLAGITAPQRNGFATAFDTASKIGQGLADAGGKIAGTWKGEQDMGKAQELIRKYNDPNDPDFAGMQGAQRMLKLGRVLLPVNPEIGQKYIAAAQAEEAKALQSQRDLNLIATEAALKPAKEVKDPAEVALFEGIDAVEKNINSPSFVNMSETEKKGLLGRRNSLQKQYLDKYGADMFRNRFGLEAPQSSEVEDPKAYGDALEELKKLAVIERGVLGNKADLVGKINGNSRLSKSQKDALKEVLNEMESTGAKTVTAGSTAAEEGRKSKEFELKQIVDTRNAFLPKVDSDKSALADLKNKAEMILSRSSTQGASYLAMKGMLGDALSTSDFVGMIGRNSWGDAVQSKIATMLGKAPTTPEEADRIVSEFIDGLNVAINSYNSGNKEKLKSSDDKKIADKVYSSVYLAPIAKKSASSKLPPIVKRVKK